MWRSSRSRSNHIFLELNGAMIMIIMLMIMIMMIMMIMLIVMIMMMKKLLR